METVRSWVLGLAGAAVCCALCMELTAEGRVKSVQKLLCSFLMTAALLGPLLKLDLSAYALQLSKYREEARTIQETAGDVSDRLSRRFIAGECEAYIWDKAAEVDAALSNVKVELRWSMEGVWVPDTVTLYGQRSAALAEMIEEGLGIGDAGQYWYEDGAD